MITDDPTPDCARQSSSVVNMEGQREEKYLESSGKSRARTKMRERLENAHRGVADEERDPDFKDWRML